MTKAINFKRAVVIGAVSAVAAAAGWMLWLHFRGSGTEAGVKREIAAANHCETNSDCEIVLAKCPFNCYAPVNKKESGRIREMIENYESRCAYMCVEIKGVACLNGKCEPVFPD